MLQTLLLGALIGAVVLAIGWTFLVVAKIHNDVTKLMGAVKLMNSKLNKLEQVSLATMAAAENFVDALRESNGELELGGPPTLSSPDDMSFDDLRESFENGIKKLEEDSDDEDSEPWKKKK